ncbi:MAG: PQQ-binding-like beta-propeller repeat protein [Acidobacteriota bacterium]|nr:PQQ-binding-like beta-propeller repeat protein [Acidobacteriota bacterium]
MTINLSLKLGQHVRLAGVVGCLSVAMSATPACLAQEASEQPPAFTRAQAEAGATAYLLHCSSCHGPQLEGIHLSPGLAGEAFDRRWRGKTADRLMVQLHRMPPEPRPESGKLGDATYASILAYLLQSNGHEPGLRELSGELGMLVALTIPLLDGMSFDPDAPVVASPGESARLTRLTAVTAEQLRHPPAADWPQWGRTYDGLNFSPLETITRHNVSDLRPAWRVPVRDGTSMPMPLVHDGVIFFQTIPDTVLALDGATGDILWRYRYTPDGQSSRKMGLALEGNTVVVPTSDLHVVALDARTGELRWDHKIEARDLAQGRGGGYQLRSAPLVVGDKVIQGVAASFVPRGGFIVAIDIGSGDEVWRFHTIARPGEPGGNSWNGVPLDERSGGSLWHQGTYDPQLNLIYFGVAPTYDTGPLLHPSGEPNVTSDALYTNCTIALDPDTGELAWHYQHMANDQWDLDWVFERQILNVEIDGLERRVVMNVGKMAILDGLDAATGEYLFSVDVGTQNIVTAIDPKTGAKTIDPAKLPDIEQTLVFCPGVSGARAWPPTSYSRRTKLLYLPLTEWCNTMGPEGFRLLTSGVGIGSAQHPDSDDGTMGRLQAIDVEGRALAWAHHQPAPLSTSALATAGGVVFAGDLDPALKAFDDTSGELLWRARLDDLPSGTLVTYGIGGTQYLLVVVGLRNNHVSDLSRTYNAFRTRRGETGVEPPHGGASIWAFALADETP